MSGTPRLPNFLIIGAQKSGTRWLRLNLGLHPQGFTAEREIEFFNHHWHLGVDWYADQFAGASPDATAVGEATPGYMMLNEAVAEQAARVDGLLPDVRLIALLRNPVERVYSAFIHHIRDGSLPANASLLDYVTTVPWDEDPLQIIAGSMYFASLRPYRNRVGDRLLVLLQDDVKRDAGGVYATACRHLDLDDTFVPGDLEQVRFSNPTPRDSDYAAGKQRRRALTPDEHDGILELLEEDTRRLGDLVGVPVNRWLRGRVESGA